MMIKIHVTFYLFFIKQNYFEDLFLGIKYFEIIEIIFLVLCGAKITMPELW